ncbi:MAG: hypothetical protein II842_02725 [Butyrivibrio sp.]|nr:hypothetical protein [Butyrivibrio sp.]
MLEQSNIYPNLNWNQFAVFNDNATDAFEDMCRDLFYCEYLHETRNPHSDHNNPGVEVQPILEPVRDDGEQQKLISFQAKYFKETVNDRQIIKSLKQTVGHYNGQLGRLYLFCNKVISKESDRFRKYEAILSPAQIELELVTDKDIFTLLRKNKRVADYYFQDRKRTVACANNLMVCPMISCSVSEASRNEEPNTINPLLQELVRDRLQKCKEAIMDLDFGKLKAELKVLNTAVEVDSEIAFFQLILAAHDRAITDDILSNVSEEYKEEAYWLKGVCNNPRDISFEEIKCFAPETQTVAMVVVFGEQRWECIVELQKCREQMPPEILKAFDFHYALALFNLRREDEAHKVLSELFRNYHEPRFELYDICAKLNRANREYIFGKTDQEKLVKGLLNDLDRVKNQLKEKIAGNEKLIATIELHSCFNLGATDKRYIDEAIIRYEGYSDNAKDFDGVLLFMAMCYEMCGDMEKSRELLSQCAWRDEEAIAARYLIVLIDLGKPKEAIEAFKEIKGSTTRTECLYLLALSKVGDENYEELLREAIDKHSTSLEDLFIYGFYVEDKNVFQRIVMPRISELLAENIDGVNMQTKAGLLAIFAHNGIIDSIETVLDSISDVDDINTFIVYDIYNCLFSISHKEYELWRNDKETDSNLLLIEKIANRFYESNILKQQFLQVKVMCVAALHMEYSMLKYSKELFEYTNDVQTARNIIALLYKRNETKKEEYGPYLKPLMESDDPQIAIAASSALWKLGRYDEADFYAYKALYNLNGKDDFDVYKGLFGYFNLNMQRISHLPNKKSISGNMIVSLKSDDETWVVALDSESDFGDRDNHSLGVEHIDRHNQVYNKLLGGSARQTYNLRGRKYEVISFEPREITVGRFIFQKITENPDKFNVRTISSEKPEEMVKQILSLSDQRDHIQKLLDAYNFKDNQLGIPIDFFCNGNYEKYITSMQYLLYTKDLAYYAGEPRLESVVEARYVPSLSTFVLLAVHGWLDELDLLKGYITIPESYIEFFEEQYAAELGVQAASPGSLVPTDDGKITIIERDKRLPDIWERIISKCESFSVTKVSDEDRIRFEVIENYTWERLFGKLNIDKMQLDGLIVAEQENGVYICDDLFFRKIAAAKRIKNINFATLLYVNNDMDRVMPIILELSKTNYIYTPIRSRNDEELGRLVENLLDGNIKRAYYSDVFNAYLDAWNQVMRDSFGDNWNDDI